jgi:hypothetical protein
VRIAEEWSPEDATFAQVDLSVFLAALGLLLIAAGWAAARGRLKRNYVIGMRTGTIMRTDATWHAAHRKCAWSLWSSGLVMAATSAAVAGLRPSREWTLALWIAMCVYLTVAVLIGLVQADKEARTVP